ncbi:hypothetical protein BWD08_10900, partial [Neisseria animaloris]|uniref:hypothetical protein n=1 Tax=Neisseria animaloris TaxID=326522 RepID=UPI000A221441
FKHRRSSEEPNYTRPPPITSTPQQKNPTEKQTDHCFIKKFYLFFDALYQLTSSTAQIKII